MRYRPAIGSTERARDLRKNATEAEKALWRLLRESFPQARFRRQVPIRSFIADFASHAAKLVIEVDGGQHSLEKDEGRTKLIEAEGYRVIRFWNNEVMESPVGVWHRIHEALSDRAPSPSVRAATESTASENASPLDDRHPHPTLPHQGGGLK